MAFAVAVSASASAAGPAASAAGVKGSNKGPIRLIAPGPKTKGHLQPGPVLARTVALTAALAANNNNNTFAAASSAKTTPTINPAAKADLTAAREAKAAAKEAALARRNAALDRGAEEKCSESFAENQAAKLAAVGAASAKKAAYNRPKPSPGHRIALATIANAPALPTNPAIDHWPPRRGPTPPPTFAVKKPAASQKLMFMDKRSIEPRAHPAPLPADEAMRPPPPPAAPPGDVDEDAKKLFFAMHPKKTAEEIAKEKRMAEKSREWAKKLTPKTPNLQWTQGKYGRGKR
jgi:hypothetical protein